MKNLFIISEDEKRRILGLHESATKRQYLSEQESEETKLRKSLNPIANEITTIVSGARFQNVDETKLVNAILKIPDVNTLNAVNNDLKKYYANTSKKYTGLDAVIADTIGTFDSGKERLRPHLQKLLGRNSTQNLGGSNFKFPDLSVGMANQNTGTNTQQHKDSKSPYKPNDAEINEDMAKEYYLKCLAESPRTLGWYKFIYGFDGKDGKPAKITFFTPSNVLKAGIYAYAYDGEIVKLTGKNIGEYEYTKKFINCNQPPFVNKAAKKRTVPTSTEQLTQKGYYLRKGDKGPLVKTIQTRLLEAGEDISSLTSVYDDMTKQAVISFQTKNNLKPDGVLGPKTWALLSNTKMENMKYNENILMPTNTNEPADNRRTPERPGEDLTSKPGDKGNKMPERTEIPSQGEFGNKTTQISTKDL